MLQNWNWVRLLPFILFFSNVACDESSSTDPNLHYGPGINADALNNTRVGGPGGTSTGWRFLCTHSGRLASFKHFVKWSTEKAGYSNGSGGTLQYELRTDDGSSSHLPGNTVLATVILNNPMSGGLFPTLSWPTPVPLNEGTIYHITCKNINPDPANNFVSLNNLYVERATFPANPTTIDRNWAVLLRYGSGPWSTRGGETPILELQYSDGFRAGQGYMEAWIGNPKAIGGSSAVRERFSVSGGNKTISQASVRLRKVSGTGALTMTVGSSDGMLLETATVANSDIPTSYAWVNFSITNPRTLMNGQSYDLILTAPSGTVYETFALADGSVNYGFDRTTVFSDGFAEFTTGGPWTGWDQWGQTNRRDGDLQFYFVLQK